MLSWLSDNAPECDVVVSTRIRLARNLAGIPFPARIMKPEDVELVHSQARRCLTKSPTFTYERLSGLSELNKRALMEGHVISSDLARSKNGGLITSDDQSLSVMIMEDDHYRLQGLGAGLSLFATYNMVDKLDQLLAGEVEYAFSDELGFLTSCPTNVGTGLRASLMLHLPALSAAKGIPRISSMIGKVGMTVRGAFGEGSTASGAFYQISNQVTLGVSEKEILMRLLSIAGKVIEFERNTRKELYSSMGTALEDKVWRAIGVLRYARRMSDAEAQKLISDVAFGVSLGFVPNVTSGQLYRIMMNARPAILALTGGLQQAQDRDAARADLLRQVFS
jgi:protein arginine kinase